MPLYQTPPPPPPQQTVAGTVLSERDQHPIPRATVTLYDENAGTTTASTHTDEAGHYQLPPVPPGKYSLSASAPGYLTDSYLHHQGYATAIITGQGLPTDALTLTLSPAATLSGTLTDDSDPITDGQLELYREDPTNPGDISSFRSTTALAGTYEFTDLPPGRYYLSASAKPWYAMQLLEARDAKYTYRAAIDPALQVLYPDTFYPDAHDSTGAQPLTLHPGEQLTANLRMTPQHPVSFTVHLPPAPEPPKPPSTKIDPNQKASLLDSVNLSVLSSGEEGRSGTVTLTHMVFGKEETVQVNFDDQNGTLTSTSVPPGRYLLSQSGPDQQGSTPVGEIDLTGAAQTISLPALKTQAGVTVTVHGLAKPAPDRPFGGVTLHDMKHPDSDAVSQALDDKGQATFTSLPPSDYRFTVSSVPFEMSNQPSHGQHLASVIINGRSAPDKLLHLTGTGKVAVVLNVVQTHTLVQGVALKEGKPFPGAMIVLVPASPDAHPGLFRRDQSDLDGTFNLLNTEPGQYILVAIEDGWPLRWNDPTALAPYLAHGIPVTIPTTVGNTFKVPTPAQTVPR